jgi:hypothetical protein
VPSFTRVEFSVGPRLRGLRLVLLVEFPDEVLQRIKKGKTSSESEAYRIALEAIRALNFGSVRGGDILRFAKGFGFFNFARCARNESHVAAPDATEI